MASSRPGFGTVWIRAVVYGILDMKEFSNDFWFTVSSGSFSPTSDLFALAHEIFANLTSSWLAAISTSATLRGAYVEFNDGTGTLGVDYYETVTGTLISDYMPEDVAVVVQKITAIPQPYARGRWFFCGAGQHDVTGSYLNGSGISDWSALAVSLKTAIISVTIPGLVLSPAHFSPHTQQLYPIINTPVIALLGTRRRRRGPF